MKTCIRLFFWVWVCLVYPDLFAVESTEKIDLMELSSEMAATMKSLAYDHEKWQASDLLHEGNGIYKKLFQSSYEDFNNQMVKSHRKTIIRNFWQSRFYMLEAFKNLETDARMNQEFEVVVRNMDRLVRSIEEILLENPYNEREELQKKGSRMFQVIDGYNDGLEMAVNPNFERREVIDSKTGRLKLRSGDVVLVRGNSYVSAAIARVADLDTQFSHLGIVHQDRKTGEWYMVESLIESGAVRTPLEESFDHGVARAVLFRHSDKDLAERAAAHVYDKVLEAEQEGNPWDYEFDMNLGQIIKGEGPVEETFTKVSCSKLVRYAFAHASKGRVALPTHMTSFTMRNRSFLNSLGVNKTEVFAPSDILLEKEFMLIAEWRDPRVTSQLRMSDMVMAKVFQWMDEGGYQFSDGWFLKTKAWVLMGVKNFIWGYPDLSVEDVDVSEILLKEKKAKFHLIRLARRALRAKLPYWINENIAKLNWMLDKTGSQLSKSVEKSNEQSITSYGLALHPREMQEEFEKEFQRRGRVLRYFKRSDELNEIPMEPAFP